MNMEIFLEGLKIPDEQVKNELEKMYPQWDFSKVNFEFNKAGERYMNNLYCPIEDESGNPHGYSDWLRVQSMKNGKGGCRKCAKLRMGPDRTDYEIYKDNFPKDRGYKFDQSEFYTEKIGKFPRRFVKNILCTKHNPPVLFAQDGVNIDNLRKDTTGCPVCRGGEYRGEKKLKEVLIEKGYTDFKKEKKFEDCKSPRESKRCTLLKFDFYLKDKDGKEILVEYDGEQHFKPNAKHGGEKAFKERVINDGIKNRYTKERGIKLIRIAYTDFNDLEKEFQSGLDSPNQLYLSSKYPKLGWNDPNVLSSPTGISEMKIVKDYVLRESQLKRILESSEEEKIKSFIKKYILSNFDTVTDVNFHTKMETQSPTSPTPSLEKKVIEVIFDRSKLTFVEMLHIQYEIREQLNNYFDLRTFGQDSEWELTADTQ